MPYTFAQLKAEISPLLWPQGEAENLVTAHNKFFIEALLEIQRWANCFQHNNSQIYRACSRFYKCGVNVMDGPNSESSRSIANSIQRLSVIDQLDPVTRRESASAPDEWCSQIFYEQVGYSKILKYQQHVESCSSCGGFANFTGIFGFNTGNFCKGNFPTPDDAEYLSSPGLPMGHHYQPQASTNSPRGRANRGVWALERGRIYIAPWLQNTETVIVEWDGIKSDWESLDIVDDNPQLKRAVRYYVAWNHAKDYDRDDVAAAAAEKSWRMALSQLMRDCREEGRIRSNGLDGISDGSDGDSGAAKGSHGKIGSGGGGGGGGEPPGCPEIATPMFNPPSGEIVTYPIFVVITSATAGAVIYFTTDGTTPTRASQLYTLPFQIASGTQVNAKAFLGVCTSLENSTDYLNAEDFSSHPPTLSVLCTDTDKSGAWYVFQPDGSKDINWNVEFAYNEGAVVKRLEMYETDENGIWMSGRSWATEFTIYPLDINPRAFNSYPIVIYSQGIQINHAYTSNLDQVGSGMHSWDLFGESVGVGSSGSHYQLIMFLTDGTKFYATHSITCDDDNSCRQLNGNGTFTFIEFAAPRGVKFTMECNGDGWLLADYEAAGDVVFLPTGKKIGDTIAQIATFNLDVTVDGVFHSKCFRAPLKCHVDPPPTTTTTTTTTTLPPCTVEITANNLTVEVQQYDCPCYTVNLAAQVSVVNGTLTGFSDGSGNHGPDYQPCLNNPGTYSFTAHATNDILPCTGSQTVSANFTVELACIEPPADCNDCGRLPATFQASVTIVHTYPGNVLVYTGVNTVTRIEGDSCQYNNTEAAFTDQHGEPAIFTIEFICSGDLSLPDWIANESGVPFEIYSGPSLENGPKGAYFSYKLFNPDDPEPQPWSMTATLT